MTDRHTPLQRKYNMSRIKSKNTRPEVKLRKLCFSLNLRYRINVKDLPGKPDIVFPKYKIIFFVNGCFWHRHKCKYGSIIPKSNTDFWKKKFSNTIKRDKKNFIDLQKLDYKIYYFWECKLKNTNKTLARVKKIFGYDGYI